MTRCAAARWGSLRKEVIAGRWAVVMSAWREERAGAGRRPQRSLKMSCGTERVRAVRSGAAGVAITHQLRAHDKGGGRRAQTGGFGLIVAGFDFCGFALAGFRGCSGGGGGGGGGGVIGGTLLGFRRSGFGFVARGCGGSSLLFLGRGRLRIG